LEDFFLLAVYLHRVVGGRGSRGYAPHRGPHPLRKTAVGERQPSGELAINAVLPGRSTQAS
jgi:hypothetical protein